VIFVIVVVLEDFSLRADHVGGAQRA